ncbi:MAG: rod shape-determining protein MreC [Acidimicrobiaceae bacterium]|nr:rod shape-determining protein MreC [Acidimicrobiaceae bacterium]MDE0517680.1 rod shape-determining protein MreC [Acidimicrobiaceae bacterium]MDE0657552.1 rod shape-determining protein MreC [Acidimicrobiaceae bacterium]MXZ96713.1 rod shape-determining protein MreC [Acidimicrobiaceae bacterium]MYF42755.1 rod shape-determining protein MreC [Acidimicrobiaceae bacterium]
MAVAQRSGRSRYRLLLLILTAATLLTLDFRGFGPLDTAQSRVRDVLEPVVSAVDVVLGPVAEVWTVMFTYNDLRSENERLKDELDRLASADIRNAAEQDALERLLDATGVTFVEGVERLTATVLRDSVGNFDDDVMSIDVGHRHGVAPGMAVVTSAGFVGRVETVDAALSTVTAVSDPSLVVGVRLLDTGDVALGHGMAGDPTRFVVDAGLRWPETGDLSELPAVGSPVVTSAGSRYPADIPVGRVASVEPSEAGLAQLVTVDLAADVQDLGYVTVLLLTPTDEAPVGPDSPFPEQAP